MEKKTHIIENQNHQGLEAGQGHVEQRVLHDKISGNLALAFNPGGLQSHLIWAQMRKDNGDQSVKNKDKTGIKICLSNLVLTSGFVQKRDPMVEGHTEVVDSLCEDLVGWQFLFQMIDLCKVDLGSQLVTFRILSFATVLATLPWFSSRTWPAR